MLGRYLMISDVDSYIGRYVIGVSIVIIGIHLNYH